MKTKRLSHVEEIELCKEAQEGCERSLERMVTHNLGLVSKITKKMYYKNEQFSYEDMFQEGVIGLMRAISKFDPKEGCRFSTYSYYWIYCFIGKFHTNNYGKVRVPSHVKEKLRKLEKTDTEEYLKLKNSLPFVTSLNNSIGDNSTLEDLVSEDYYTELDCELEVVKDQMKNVLSEREYGVMCHRYGLDGFFPKSQRECGKIFGVSYAMIHLIEKKSMNKLRQHFV
jgi:RNA polymerase primary sigma factor